MVAIRTTEVANILNCFTFTKDRLVVLELIALWVHFKMFSSYIANALI